MSAAALWAQIIAAKAEHDELKKLGFVQYTRMTDAERVAHARSLIQARVRLRNALEQRRLLKKSPA